MECQQLILFNIYLTAKAVLKSLWLIELSPPLGEVIKLPNDSNIRTQICCKTKTCPKTNWWTNIVRKITRLLHELSFNLWKPLFTDSLYLEWPRIITTLQTCICRGTWGHGTRGLRRDPATMMMLTKRLWRLRSSNLRPSLIFQEALMARHCSLHTGLRENIYGNNYIFT